MRQLSHLPHCGYGPVNTNIVFLSDYDSYTNQYDPSCRILLLHFESIVCFFLSKYCPGLSSR